MGPHNEICVTLDPLGKEKYCMNTGLLGISQ